MTDHDLQLCLDGDPVLTSNLVNAYLRLQAEVERLRTAFEVESALMEHWWKQWEKQYAEKERLRAELAQERERCALVVQDNSERAIDPVIKAVLILNAQEIRHHGKGDRQ